MNRVDLVAVLRMGERALIVLGGILSIFLGYQLFAMGIDVAQGQARAFGIELRDFGPGLFFAALGAYVLVQALHATIRSGIVPTGPGSEEAANAENQKTTADVIPPAASATSFFFGIEDPKRQLNKWSAKSFFLETRDLLRQLEAGSEARDLEALRSGLRAKLETITMTPAEFERYKILTNKPDQSSEEQREFLEIEGKLFP